MKPVSQSEILRRDAIGVLGMEALESIEPHFGEGGNRGVSAGQAGMSHNGKSTRLMDEFNSFVHRHLELGHPGRFALFQKAFESFIEAAAELACSQGACHMRSSWGSTIGESEYVIDEQGNSSLVNPADHFPDAVLPDLLEPGQLLEQFWIGRVEEVAEHMDFVLIDFRG